MEPRKHPTHPSERLFRPSFLSPLFTLTALLLAAVAGLILFVPSANAQPATFTLIADNSSGQLGNFGFAPALNDNGTVAFQTSTSTGAGIFTGSGGALTTIALSNGSGNFAGFGGRPSINNTGLVAFYAGSPSSGMPALYIGNGAVTTTIVEAQSSGRFYGFGGSPRLSQSGSLAYFGGLNGGGTGIYLSSGNGATTTTVAETGSGYSSLLPDLSVNASDTVAFAATSSTSGFQGIYRTGAGGIGATLIASILGPFDSVAFPSINSSGLVSFRAGLDAGGTGLFVGSGTTNLLVADSSGPIRDFDFSSINDAGLVAFHAELDAGGFGIFAGYAGGTAQKVIQTGDLLFGSAVTTLDFYDQGLNNNNQVAFNFALADGRRGIARATISPSVGASELPSGAYLLPGPVFLWRFLCRRKKREAYNTRDVLC